MAASPRRSLRFVSSLLPLLALGAALVGVGYVAAREVGPGDPGAEEALAPPVTPAPSASAAAPQASATVAAEPPVDPADDVDPPTLEGQRERLIQHMTRELGLGEGQVAEVRRIFAGSRVLGQGNPDITKHPMTRAECRAIRAEAGLPLHQKNAHCPAPNMVPLYDPGAGQTEADAKVCIDQLEFPDIACEYPVVFVQAREVAELCKAVGKRICDAHEWEGGCAGALLPAEKEYAFGQQRKVMKSLHNLNRTVRWAYGDKKDHALCGTASHKDEGCAGGGYKHCGSNTYPAGSFPKCVSPLGVFDQHGNVAEHMNLPLRPEELASRGGTGETEMKGSWFIFSRYEAHEDDCRWRAPDWHGTKVMSVDSHLNYHLGFRCCADVAP